MTDETSQEFRIHIVSDADNTGFKDAAGAGAELDDKVKDFGQTIELTDQQTKKFIEDAARLKDGENATGESAHRSGAEHRALHAALHKLNELIPGLGTTIGLLEHGMEGEAAAAREGAVANESFIASMGPIAILVLGIQAVMTYWDLYKAKIKDVEAQQSAMFKKFDDDTKSALGAWQAFQDASHPQAEAAKKYSDEISLQNALLEKQVAANKEIIKNNEAAEIAKAKTPEEKDEIKRRYARQEKAQDEFSEGRKNSIDEQARDEIETDIANRSKQVEDARQKIVVAQKNGDDYSQLTAFIAENSKAVDALEKMLGELNTKINEATQVQAAGRSGDAAVEKAKVLSGGENPTIEKGAAVAYAGTHGEKINQAQLQQLNDLRAIFTSILGNTDALNAALRYSRDRHLTQAQETELIKNQLAALSRQTSASATSK